MLPFDNKSEFQVIVDMPEGTPLERTFAVEQEIGAHLHTQPEVVNYQVYAGISGPYNFNGLVRHYYLRRGANQGDIQVNLRSVDERSRQSHDLAKQMRGPFRKSRRKWNARIKVAEVPPGPPVISTLVAEVYGPDYKRQIASRPPNSGHLRRRLPGLWTPIGTSSQTRRNTRFPDGAGQGRRSGYYRGTTSPKPWPFRWLEKTWD